MAGYAAVSAQVLNNRGANYWTYRYFYGQVRMRLLDVTRTAQPSYQWTHCEFDISLVNAAGATLSNRIIYKSWGVKPPYVNIAGFSSTVSARIRINHMMILSAPSDVTVDWRGELSWG